MTKQVELTDLELLEVSLVDAGDDPLAKVAIFKQKEENMTEETKADEADLEKAKKPMQSDAENAAEDAAEGPGSEMTEEEMAAQQAKKPAKKSYKAEAEALAEANDALVEKVDELEAKVSTLEKALDDAKEVNKQAKEETIEIGGEVVAKSAIPAVVLKELEEVQKEREKAALEKKAEELIPNVKGTTEVKAKFIKALDLNDEELVEFIRAMDGAFAGAFDEVGKGKAHEFESAQEQLDAEIAKYAEDHEVTVAKATSAFVKTAKGKELYNKAMKERQ
jgi:hypothetical protein